MLGAASIARNARLRIEHAVSSKEIGPFMASALDLTRWVAALLVLIYHVRENVLVPAADASESLRSALVSLVYLVTNCGDQAVTWFFITSGFLVGGSAVSDIVSGRFEGRHYLVNRISRIYAVYLPALALGFTLDLIRVGLFGISVNAGGETVASYSAFTAILNVLNLQTILSPTLGSNIPLWSIAYEMFYYITFPFIFIVFWKGRLDLKVLLILLLYFTIVFKNNTAILHYFFIWALGAVARFMPRLIFPSPMLAWVAAVAACFSFPDLATLLGGGAKIVLGLAFANALLAARFSSSPVLLKIAPINALLASFSFSLYVLHAPALHFILALASGHGDPRLSLQPSGWEAVSWGVGLTFALVLYAFAFSLFTERKTHVVRAFLESKISKRYSNRVKII